MDELRKIKLSKPQIDVLKARTPLILDMAGQGGGKTMNIGISSFEFIRSCPRAKGFIGANTHEQLTKSTLVKCFKIWKDLGDWSEYNSKTNPNGIFVVNKKPPSHFMTFETLDDYRKTISFQNGALIFTGSLKNYLAHDGKEFAWCHLDETKDTKKEALTDVILGRLRQFGLWYDDKRTDEKFKPFFFDQNISHEEAEEKGYKALNPCYVHTSPSPSGVEWLLELFNLKKFEKEIREKLSDKMDFFYNVFENTTAVIYQTYWNENNLPPNFISNQIKRMTSNEVELFINGNPFVKTGAEYYSEFSRRKQVLDAKIIPYDFNGSFHISLDFNAVPYMTLLVAQIRTVEKYINDKGVKKEFITPNDEGFFPFYVTQVIIQKEILGKQSENMNDTDKVCIRFCEWLQLNEANASVFGYGDGTGNNRFAGIGSLTNFKIVQNVIEKYFFYEKRARKYNPPNRLRRTFVNRIFKGVYPEIEVYISSECEELIRDMDFTKQATDGGKFKEMETDKSTGQKFQKIGHTGDALEYLLCELFREQLKTIN